MPDPDGHQRPSTPRATPAARSDHATSLRAGHFCVLCPKANSTNISALFGSLSSSLGVSIGSFGRGSKLSSDRPEGGLQLRIAALVGTGGGGGGSGTGGGTGGAGSSPAGSSGATGEGRKKQPVAASSPPGQSALTANTWNPAPHTWHLGHGAAAVVNFGLLEVTTGINRVQPSVFFNGASDEPHLCVFQGYLSNLEELMARYMREDRLSSSARMAKPKKSPGEKAAELLYAMFCDDRNGEDPLIVLSELQGQYAFVMYNGDKKQVFAARDSSGKERLYFEVDDENGVTVSNAGDLRVRSVDGVGWVVFEELPPGHYMCGRPVKIHQFALTREEMKERECFLEGGLGMGIEL